MDIDGKDELIASLPIHFSQSLHPRLHLHQFQLHTRPLEVPPTAAQAGKIIKARYKPAAGKYEIHVPTDVRPEVWNALAGQTYGAARYEEDKDEALMQDIKFKSKEPHELRLNETRLLSERVAHSGEYVLGVMRDGKLHLHPISETHQFGPSLSYLDQLSKSQHRPARGTGADSDEESDDPPPDPDDPPTASTPANKKQSTKKPIIAREVTVAARRTGEDAELGGLSSLRKEMILKRRNERSEPWLALDYCDTDTSVAQETLEKLFSTSDEVLTCTTTMDAILRATYK